MPLFIPAKNNDGVTKEPYLRSTPTSSDCVTRRHAAATAILFTAVTVGAWQILPAPRWALVTLGASAALLQIGLLVAAFPVSRRVATLATVTTFICHGVAISFTLDVAPTLSLGDPPGRMLSSFSIQSATHSIRYRVPFPQKSNDRMRVRLLLSRGYEGPTSIRIDISGVSEGVMRIPVGGNISEREYIFEMAPFRELNSVILTLRQDNYDSTLRIAFWKSGLGRAIEGEAEYATEFGKLRGLPDPMTGALAHGWPLIWIQDV